MAVQSSQSIVVIYASDSALKTTVDLSGLEPIPVRWIDDLDDLIKEVSLVHPVSVVLMANHDNIATMRACHAVRQASKAPIHIVSATLSEPEVQLARSIGATTVLEPNTAMSVIVQFIWQILAVKELPGTRSAKTMTAAGLTLDLARRIVRIDGKTVSLTRTEFDLLAVLVKMAGSVVSRADLVASVWGENWFGVGNMLDTHLTHLRRKIGFSGYGRTIVNVRGVGFYFEPENVYSMS